MQGATLRGEARLLVQLLLPLTDNEGRPFPAALFADVRDELVAAWGGLTVHARAPARGLWHDGDALSRDEVLLCEVMVAHLDEVWWSHYRRSLELRFRQQQLIVRAHAIRLL